MPHSTGTLSTEQGETTTPLLHGPLASELVGKLLAGLPGWTAQEGNRALVRRYAFPGRRAAVAFAQFVTELVETGGYNAWIELRAEVAVVTLFSPRVGGVTLADLQLASMLGYHSDAAVSVAEHEEG